MMKPFDATDIDYRSVSEQLLIDACKSGEYPLVGGCEYGRLVVRIANNAVIKYGRGVTAAEATTQAYVHSHVDASVFRVPEVYRFFEDGSGWDSMGYLTMEFIEGTTLDKIDEKLQSEFSKKMAACLQHLWQLPIPADGRPGPIGGGEPKGKIWSDDGACTVFDSLSDMEDWLNVSLGADENLAKMGRWDILDYRAPLDTIHHRLSLGKCSLVISHGDFVGRNIILQPDGGLCILDWGCAGLYPLFFDLYSIVSNESFDPAMLGPLLQRFIGLRTDYAQELELLRRVQRANTVFSRSFLLSIRFPDMADSSPRAPEDRQIQFSFDDLEPCPESYWPENGATALLNAQ